MSTSDSQGGSPLSGQVPRHVAIIMDGNGRWAKEKGLSRVSGHRAGVETLRRILPAAVELGIEMLTLYAFSTENWNRPRAEVRALMVLMERTIDGELNELSKCGVRVRHVGGTEGLPRRLVAKIERAQRATEHNDRLLVNVAFNYGGRADIVQAVQRLIAEGVPAERVDEEAIDRRLWTDGLPEPDLIIRTAGEMRLSNFLIWQAAYSEFYSTTAYWPDFDRSELERALLDYQRRERRFGALPASTG